MTVSVCNASETMTHITLVCGNAAVLEKGLRKLISEL